MAKVPWGLTFPEAEDPGLSHSEHQRTEGRMLSGRAVTVSGSPRKSHLRGPVLLLPQPAPSPLTPTLRPLTPHPTLDRAPRPPPGRGGGAGGVPALTSARLRASVQPFARAQLRFLEASGCPAVTARSPAS